MHARRSFPRALALLLLLFLSIGASGQSRKPPAAIPRYLKLENLSVSRLQRLDRGHTVIVITLGVLEEHGPHLPISVDTIHAEAITRRVIQIVNRERPQWTVLRFPLIPLGVRGTNVLGAKPTYMGSFTLRPGVLRDLLVDLGTMLSEQGFRDVLVVYAHGNPMHSQMVNEACAFVRQSTGSRMWNLTGLALSRWDRPMNVAAAKCLSAEQRDHLGADIHAGLMETSVILYLAPGLVDPGYKKLPPVPALSFTQVLQQGRKPNWPGYWSYPNWASAECGRLFVQDWMDLVAGYAPRALSGEDLSRLPSYPGTGMSEMDATTAALLQHAEEAVQAYEDARTQNLRDWLKAHGR